MRTGETAALSAILDFVNYTFHYPLLKENGNEIVDSNLCKLFGRKQKKEIYILFQTQDKMRINLLKVNEIMK